MRAVANAADPHDQLRQSLSVCPGFGRGQHPAAHATPAAAGINYQADQLGAFAGGQQQPALRLQPAAHRAGLIDHHQQQLVRSTGQRRQPPADVGLIRRIAELAGQRGDGDRVVNAGRAQGQKRTLPMSMSLNMTQSPIRLQTG